MIERCSLLTRDARRYRQALPGLQLITLDIEDDMLPAAKQLARRQGLSAGKEVSRLLRAALSCADLVTNDQIDQLRDQTGV